MTAGSSGAPDASIEEGHPEAVEPHGGLAVVVPQVPAERVESNESNNGGSDGELSSEKWTARNSFTADSPYFNAFCDAEVKQLHTMSDALREISRNTQALTQTGVAMAHAAQHLSASCKFQSVVDIPPDETTIEKDQRLHAMKMRRHLRKQAVGDEMASFLQVLGDVSVICA